MTETRQPDYLTAPDGERIAYHSTPGTRDYGLLWLGGFKSDMDGTKALAIEDWARGHKITSTRFDYFAHGASSGNFAEGTLSRWIRDTLQVMDEVAKGPQILIGSSMGGWIALKVALARPDLVKALLLIAPAPDFTGDLMWDTFTPEIQAQLSRGEPYKQPSDYDDEPYLITAELIEDGRTNFVLPGPLSITCPVRIAQGMADPDVPWERTLKLTHQIESPDLDITLVKEGDHRFSDPHCLKLLTHILEELTGQT
ncbi:MAG: alpha/beta hydrolase [Alphaproteobacteria bacterium]|nr:MAG: alpha/beta hydrolase [Alphaproteobacteria bacterium]